MTERLLKNPVRCIYCHGTGKSQAPGFASMVACLDCEGTGKRCNLCGEPSCDCPAFDPQTSKASK